MTELLARLDVWGRLWCIDWSAWRGPHYRGCHHANDAEVEACARERR